MGRLIRFRDTSVVLNGVPSDQEGATFFSEGARHIGTLNDAHIILTGAMSGSERAPQGFILLSMQSTTMLLASEVCVGRRCTGRGY